MRKLFFNFLHGEMEKNDNIVLLTADMGYGLLNQIRDDFPRRFFNVFSAEQLMIGCAAGLAMDGKIPVCYSITPFLLYRPFEFIRNFMNNDKLNIKLAGGGRDDDYGYLGSTHHAFEDISIMSQLPNIQLFKPKSDGTDDFSSHFNSFLYSKTPSYINLIK